MVLEGTVSKPKTKQRMRTQTEQSPPACAHSGGPPIISREKKAQPLCYHEVSSDHWETMTIILMLTEDVKANQIKQDVKALFTLVSPRSTPWVQSNRARQHPFNWFLTRTLWTLSQPWSPQSQLANSKCKSPVSVRIFSAGIFFLVLLFQRTQRFESQYQHQATNSSSGEIKHLWLL